MRRHADPFNLRESAIMTIWNNSKMSTVYYSDDSASENDPCVVKITENEILVEYDDDGLVQYRGANDGSGHFVLNAEQINGRASLHMFAQSSILEGSWIEGGYRGMWRIELG